MAACVGQGDIGHGADFKAQALSGNIPAILDTLAAAQAATGDFKAATATATKALSLARTSARELVPMLEKAAAAYSAGRMP